MCAIIIIYLFFHLCHSFIDFCNFVRSESVFGFWNLHCECHTDTHVENITLDSKISERWIGFHKFPFRRRWIVSKDCIFEQFIDCEHFMWENNWEFFYIFLLAVKMNRLLSWKRLKLVNLSWLNSTNLGRFRLTSHFIFTRK